MIFRFSFANTIALANVFVGLLERQGTMSCDCEKLETTEDAEMLNLDKTRFGKLSRSGRTFELIVRDERAWHAIKAGPISRGVT